ncbi:epoxide hydrolase [Aquincola tertiaricarbonis]|uniref:Epoxide hydrolase n=1 Tax=Aquincola tertiaricarbonis TaxID=391953 RepID=A0ABY4S584_AQUTE|nr:epoxide hydrolase family protein [Aquincola tertiaricarbonis]URI07599.1 epoxide hydrolase [Aquincola tertiaricarbonis]
MSLTHASPRPFQLQVPQADLDELQQRLARTRWPDEPPGEAPWSSGTDMTWLRSLVAHWQHGFDWRAQEARLNAWPQFKCPVGGIDLHYLHAPGEGPRPMPLLLLHGWPGSVFEFMDLLPRLTQPSRFGGAAADAFTVVAPSLPGYGLSFTPGQRRIGIDGMADLMATLMSDVLGYPRFGAQGGDWGASVAARLGWAHAPLLHGIHLNLMPIPREPAHVTGDSDEERRYLAELRRWLAEETGYSLQQSTRPQTLAYAMTDSPVGLAAWISEKFRAWSDCGGDVDSVFSHDALLADISLYWFTGAIGASFWPYYARRRDGWPVPEGATVDVPTGYAEFPAEIVRPPRSLAARTFTQIQRWQVMPRGGHFAAMEQPQALAEEIRAFFRPLRA